MVSPEGGLGFQQEEPLLRGKFIANLRRKLVLEPFVGVRRQPLARFRRIEQLDIARNPQQEEVQPYRFLRDRPFFPPEGFQLLFSGCQNPVAMDILPCHLIQQQAQRISGPQAVFLAEPVKYPLILG